MKTAFFIWFAIVVFALVGEVKCIAKAIRCDWDPIGKAEVIYTASACCGLGSIVGWFDIEDTPKTPAPTENAEFRPSMVMPEKVYVPQPRNFAYRRM